MSDKQYRNFDLDGSDFDNLSEGYALHVDRMTAENLHSKADIAWELAHRDYELSQTKAELESALANAEEQKAMKATARKQRDLMTELWEKNDKELEALNADNTLMVGYLHSIYNSPFGIEGYQKQRKVPTHFQSIALGALNVAQDKYCYDEFIAQLQKQAIEKALNDWREHVNSEYDKGRVIGSIDFLPWLRDVYANNLEPSEGGE